MSTTLDEILQKEVEVEGCQAEHDGDKCLHCNQAPCPHCKMWGGRDRTEVRSIVSDEVKQAIEAYIAERETALTKDLMNKAISFTANNDAGYFINSGLADVFDKKLDELELKSNER